MADFTFLKPMLWVVALVGLLPAAPAVAQPAAGQSVPRVAAPPAPPARQFVANRGQWAQPVLFAADVPGGRLFLERGRLTQALYDAAAVEKLHERKPDGRDHRIRAHAYSVTFVGADAQAAVRGELETNDKSNYFLGRDQSKWATAVPGYQEVRYQQLYPGTNLRFYTHEQQLEYDFELAPGADVARIRLRYAGQQRLAIINGAVHVTTSVGTVVEQRPVAYQLRKGQRVPVRCAYALGADHTLSFTFPQGYDHSAPLVIDPVLVYSSYTGSTADNWGYTATYDAQGNLYAGGAVFAAGYPTTVGAYDVSFADMQDYGIMKFNPTAATGAASRLYATYLGGGSEEHPHSMVVDPAGNLVILGTTNSADFPTTERAFDRSFNGNDDIVVSKLNPLGTQLLASTFLGGSGSDGQLFGPLDKNYNDTYRGDVTTDAQGSIYLASFTASGNFPISGGGFQATKGARFDGVVVKFAPDLATLTWSTFLGGSGDDAAYSVQVAADGAVFVSGGTNSANFPGTTGGLNPQYRGGSADGFVARLSAAGTSLMQASYIGTSGYDQAYFLQLDAQNEVYLFGQTDGAYPVSSGVYVNPNSRQFLHKLDPLLRTTRFSTVIGNGNSGPTNLSPTAFLVDNCGQILLSGFGGNVANMPVTPNAIQRGGPGTSDDFGYFYIMQLSANAAGLVYGTYFGNGSCHVDGGTSRFDKRGIIYQAMCVGSGPVDLPTTPNAWSVSRNAPYNNAAFKIDVLQLDATFTASGVPGGARIRRGCAPLTVYFTRPSVSGTSSSWNFGNGQTSTSNSAVVSTVYAAPGRYIAQLTVADPTSCLQTATAVDTIDVFGLPPAAAGPDRTICQGGSVTLSVPDAGQGVAYAWFPPTGLSTSTGRSVVASPGASTFYILTTTTPSGCNAKDTVLVSVLPRPQVRVAAAPPNAFTGAPMGFSSTVTGAQGAVSYLWSFGDGQTSTGAAPTHQYARAGSYPVRLTTRYPSGLCEQVQELAVEIRQFELPNVITPNNDGLNDSFKPFVSFQPVDITIFNRWGKQIFEQAGYTEGWGPENVPGGVYYYKLSSSTGESWKGWIEVVR